MARAEGGSVHEVRLRLHDLDQLFEVPASNWYSDEGIHRTGIDRLVGEARAIRAKQRTRVVVELPASKIDAETAPRVQRAIGRYCEEHIVANDHEVQALRVHGWEALGYGTAIFVVGLVIAQVLHRFDDEVVSVFLADGIFLVLAWVALWYPLDVLVYAPRTFHQQNRALRALAGAEVVVEPMASGSAGAA